MRRFIYWDEQSIENRGDDLPFSSVLLIFRAARTNGWCQVKLGGYLLIDQIHLVGHATTGGVLVVMPEAENMHPRGVSPSVLRRSLDFKLKSFTSQERRDSKIETYVILRYQN